jgi:hypothetical protein
MLNIFGLLSNLAGVFLLFLFGMPFRVATGGKSVTWITSSIDLQVKKWDDIYSVLSWIGLAAIVFSTLLQVLATLGADSSVIDRHQTTARPATAVSPLCDPDLKLHGEDTSGARWRRVPRRARPVPVSARVR